MCKAPYQICVDSFLSTEPLCSLSDLKKLFSTLGLVVQLCETGCLCLAFFGSVEHGFSQGLCTDIKFSYLFFSEPSLRIYVYQAKGLTREQIKLMKTTRRTMKNRGYAASCRVKRETQITELKVKKKNFLVCKICLALDLIYWLRIWIDFVLCIQL